MTLKIIAVCTKQTKPKNEVEVGRKSDHFLRSYVQLGVVKGENQFSVMVQQQVCQPYFWAGPMIKNG